MGDVHQDSNDRRDEYDYQPVSEVGERDQNDNTQQV